MHLGVVVRSSPPGASVWHINCESTVMHEAASVVTLNPPPGSHERVGVAYHGRLTLEASRELFEIIEDHDRRHAKLRLLVDMRDYQSAEFAVAWEKLHHMRASFHVIERMAVVGDQRWLEVWLRLASHLVPLLVRHFHGHELDAAWAWLDE